MFFLSLLLVMVSGQGYALNMDESASYTYASDDARIYWPAEDFGQWLAFAEHKPLIHFKVEDRNRERPMLLKLPELHLTQRQLLLAMRANKPKGVSLFFSKEAPDLKAPTLLLYTDSDEYYVQAGIDTYVKPNLRKVQGTAETLRVGEGRIALLHFSLPGKLALEQIHRAELLLHLRAEQEGENEIELLQLSVGEESAGAQSGLAASYPQDKLIGQHQAVYYAENFDSQSWMDSLSEKLGTQESTWSNAATLKYLTHQQAGYFLPSEGRSAVARFTPDKNLALNLDYYFAKHHGNEPEEAYVRYYLKLAEGADISGGGKLPGFGGTYNKAGWGGRPNDGYQGWSARGAFMGTIDNPQSPFHGHMPIGSYLYEAIDERKYGRVLPWGHPLAALAPGRWVCIEQHLKLNTPGQNDGLLEVWIDGVKILIRDQLIFRHTTELKIEKIWFNFYFGGVEKPKRAFDMYLDNIVIASQYIGPMQK
ncbi:DNRLRE domain-containing protein [Bowmanella dokdonensis]